MTYINHLKFGRFRNDMDSYFSRACVINFDIIHHECWGNPLQNLKQYYETIHNKDFDNYESHVQNHAVSSAIKSERDDIYFEHELEMP